MGGRSPGEDHATEPRAGGVGTPSTPAAVRAVAQVFVADLDELALTADDSHHLGDVLRARPGEIVVAADGAGRWRRCRYRGSRSAAAAGTGAGLLEAVGPVAMVPRPHPPVTVAFVPVKGTKPEWVVQKLTEAGVDDIVVLTSARSVVRWEGDRRSRAVERLARVAREAASQSRRAWIPTLGAATGLGELMARLDPVPLALAHPGGPPPTMATPAVAVGPEGGWDASETAVALHLVGLGSTVMRAETAAMAAGLLLCALRAGVVGPPAEGAGAGHEGAGT